MRRKPSLVLVLAMLFLLCGCGLSEQAEPVPTVEAQMGEGLNVGYAKVDITPEYSVGIGGYSDSETRRSQGVVNRIYAT